MSGYLTSKRKTLIHALYASLMSATLLAGSAYADDVQHLGLVQTGPSATRYYDGSMVVFARDGYGALWFKRQIVVDGKITGWRAYWENAFNGGNLIEPNLIPLGGYMNSDPVAIARGQIKINTEGGGSATGTGGPADIFYVGNNGDIWHTEQYADTGWGMPHTVNGTIGVDIDPVTNKPHASKVEVPVSSQVSVAYDMANDQAQLFYTSTNGAIATYTQLPKDGFWDGHPTLLQPAGSSSSNLDVVDGPDGKRYVAYRTTDMKVAVFTMQPNAKTITGKPMMMGEKYTVTSDVKLAWDSNTKAMDIFYRYADNSYWEIPGKPGGTWDTPKSLGDRYAGDPVIRYLPGGLIEVFGKSTDGGLTFVAQDNEKPMLWKKHVHMLGQGANFDGTHGLGPTASNNSTGLTLLSKAATSLPVTALGLDGMQYIFYVNGQDLLQEIHETKAPTAAEPYPLDAGGSPAWTLPFDLGGSTAFKESAGSIPADFNFNTSTR